MLLQLSDLPALFFRSLPAGQAGAYFIQFIPSRSRFAGGPFRLQDPGLNSLGRPVTKGNLMIFQLLQIPFRLGLAQKILLCFPAQTDQIPLLSLQRGQFRFRFRKQTGAVITAGILQFLQFGPQHIPGAAFVACGDQGVEPTAQRFVLSHRQIIQPEESRSGEHAPFHTQQHLAAVGAGQLRHFQARGRFISLEHAERGPALCPALNGDIPAIPAQVDPALHGTAGPGGVLFLLRQGVLCGSGTGVDTVEHCQQEGAPGAFAPLIGSFNDVQSGLQFQRLVFQFTEGGPHFVNSHGSLTSCPSRICRETLAAKRIIRCSASSLPSMAPRSIPK